MNTISFVTANYVARESKYNLTHGWKQGDKATNEYFKPLNTFEERFSKLLSDIREIGFEAIDLWSAHLNPVWATDNHLLVANNLLNKRGIKVTSLAGKFGNNLRDFEQTCKVAIALNVKILGGVAPVLGKNRSLVVSILKKYGLKLAIENHQEKTPKEMIIEIGNDTDVIGTTIDTGWYGTHSYDAAQAIKELDTHIFHVHLKDIQRPGRHDTCRYGLGCVPIERCVKALEQIGYRGTISIEHEPELYDPTDECKANLTMLKGWQDAH